MSIGGTDGLALVIYHPTPGSADAEKLTLLAAMTLPAADAGPGTARLQR